MSEAGEICSFRGRVAICVFCANDPIASCVSAARAQKLFLLGISAALPACKVLDADPERM